MDDAEGLRHIHFSDLRHIHFADNFYPIYILDSLKKRGCKNIRRSRDKQTRGYTETRSYRVSSGRAESFRGRTRQETAQ